MAAAVIGAWEDARAATPAAGLVGTGFWVQGFRCFPWLGVNFFLKDGLGVSPSTLQLLQNSANLPMVFKPLYGVLSDAVYIHGARRLPYIALGAMLQAISWLVIAVLPDTHATISNLSFLLLLGNLGAAIGEVANDAIVIEAGKQSGRLQSFVWMCGSSGGLMGNLLCGVCVNRLGPRSIFFVYALILAVQFAFTLSISEQSLDLQKEQLSSSGSALIRRPQSHGQFMLSTDVRNGFDEKPSRLAVINEQLYKLLDAIRIPDISRSLCWLVVSYSVVPILLSTMFYYQTQHLNLNSSVVGLSKVFGQAAVLAWSVVYNNWLKDVSPRRLISALQAAIALVMLSDVVFVKGMHRHLGFSDSTYVILFSGLLEVMMFFKVLPFSVLMAQLCPPGCEGSLMAFAMSTIALSMIISGYLGVALVAFLGISGEDFSGLAYGIVIQAACAIIPLFWSSWISEGVLAKKHE